MVSFRPTLTQAFGRGVLVGAVFGLGISAAMALLWALGLVARTDWVAAVAVLAPLLAGAMVGATVGIGFGRNEGADVDDVGIHPVPVAEMAPVAPWWHVTDLRTERWGGRTRISVYFDTGQIARLSAPYHGRWLAADPEFERKLFMLRHLWETHRAFSRPLSDETDAAG